MELQKHFLTFIQELHMVPQCKNIKIHVNRSVLIQSSGLVYQQVIFNIFLIIGK